MAYQFAHLETYARKANAQGQSTSFVFDEVMRVAEASRHVETPLPPVLLFGVSPDDVRAEHDVRAAAATMTNAKGQTRKIRQDQHTLATVVLSHPGGDGVAAWEEDSIAWLRERYGAELRSVVRHDDESYPHLHAYIMPGDMRAKSLHPGASAKAEAMAAGADNKAGDAAYRAAMRAWQDDYWNHVGMRHGLARIGPGKRRLSREAWRQEQAQVQRVQVIERRVAELRDESNQRVRAARDELVSVRAVAKRAAADAKAAHDQARELRDRAAGELVLARRQAKAIIIEAEKKAEPMRRLGNRLGRAWSGFRHVEAAINRRADERVQRAREEAADQVKRTREEIRADVGDEVERLRRAARDAERERDASLVERIEKHRALVEERQARQKAEAERVKLQSRLDAYEMPKTLGRQDSPPTMSLRR